MHEGNLKSLGCPKPQTFEVKSGAVFVSDPCYKLDTWCAKKLENVRNGKWLATVEYSNEGSWGIRVARLVAWHSDLGTNPEALEFFESISGTLGVDSGQMSIFDYDKFKGDSDDVSEDGSDPRAWYMKACDLTNPADEDGNDITKMIAFGVYELTGRVLDIGSEEWVKFQTDEMANDEETHVLVPGSNPSTHEVAKLNHDKMCEWVAEHGLGRWGIYDDCGVVSSSGFGDGSYDLTVQRDGIADIVAIEVTFIVEGDEDDEDEEV
jgi:hypothetical protein